VSHFLFIAPEYMPCCSRDHSDRYFCAYSRVGRLAVAECIECQAVFMLDAVQTQVILRAAPDNGGAVPWR